MCSTGRDKLLFPSASRSADYGSTYNKVSLAPGGAIITSFYICPTNKKKVRAGHASSSVSMVTGCWPAPPHRVGEEPELSSDTYTLLQLFLGVGPQQDPDRLILILTSGLAGKKNNRNLNYLNDLRSKPEQRACCALISDSG